MKNLGSVFAAYLVGWAIFFGYCVSVGRRMTALRDEVERLKNMLKRG
ncbi:MAG: CcmD family protein [Candidatus Acidiferrales bacterium]|jgi:CcmD family protein